MKKTPKHQQRYKGAKVMFNIVIVISIQDVWANDGSPSISFVLFSRLHFQVLLQVPNTQ